MEDLFKDSSTIEEVAEVVTNNRVSKGELMKVAYKGNTRNLDSAIPASLHDKLDTYWYVMDYQTNSFGELVHLGEKIINK